MVYVPLLAFASEECLTMSFDVNAHIKAVKLVRSKKGTVVLCPNLPEIHADILKVTNPDLSVNHEPFRAIDIKTIILIFQRQCVCQVLSKS